MYFNDIRLKNFRNYKNISINLHKDLNILIGNNGEGKTNILESIYFLSLLKSHRTIKLNDLINFKEEYTEIFTNITNDNDKKIVTYLKFDKLKGKNVSINNLDINRLADFIGYIKVVMIAPEDMKIIKDSPSIRRKFLDINISQIDKIYLKSILKYNKVLNLKNNLLKEKNINDKLLDVYDEQISLCSGIIINKRLQYIDMLNKFSKSIHNDISCNKENINIVYKSFIDLDVYKNNENMKNKILDILKNNRNIDKIKKSSSSGIHRDDFMIFINNMEALNYSSQGQQKSAIISIKLSIVKIIKEITKEYPVLLLDDILSELDSKRRKFLLNFLPYVQTFITCTEIHEKILRPCKIFNISKGEILEEC